MIKFKAWNASNSRAIAKFHNAEIGHFGHNAFIHELIIGSLIGVGTDQVIDRLYYLVDGKTEIGK